VTAPADYHLLSWVAVLDDCVRLRRLVETARNDVARAAAAERLRAAQAELRSRVMLAAPEAVAS
jgi:hypothetical protein